MLPDKPSELIKLALNDLEKAEKSSDYVIDMSQWKSLSKNTGKCSVCLAGSVMAGTLQVPVWMEVHDPEVINGLSDSDIFKLMALDEFRQGYIEGGLEIMRNTSYFPTEEVDTPDVYVRPYHTCCG